MIPLTIKSLEELFYMTMGIQYPTTPLLIAVSALG